VALDRQSLEKKDFPIGRRGYDPQVVDAHLTAIAEEVEELKTSARRRSESLAAAASDQVRAIVEAAENTASQIQREAEQEAKDIRREARTEAEATREDATTRAAEYVSRVSETTSAMLDRLGAIEQELGSIADNLRTGATRVGSDLQLLETNLAEVKDAVSPRVDFQPEPPGAAPVAEAAAPAPEAAPEPVHQPTEEADVLEPEIPASPEPVSAAPEAPSRNADDIEGARLIALNMALNGTPRDEVDRYLAENFDLNDRAALIEEVYASVEG
jgi:cell division septum initiation protein DivIVA